MARAGRRAAVLVTAAVGLSAMGLTGGWGVGTPPAAAARALTPFGSCAEVDAWLAQARPPSHPVPQGVPAAEANQLREGGVTTSASSANDAVGPGQTGTNTQERDVDEPTIAAAKDGRLYTVAAGRLRVLDVSGPTPVQLGSVAIAAANRANGPTELLVTGDRVVVLSSRVSFPVAPAPRSEPSSPTAAPGVKPADPHPQPVVTSSATVVDVSRPAQPVVVNAVTRVGWTVTARLSEGRVQWVTSSVKRPTHLDCRAIHRPRVASGAGIVSVDTLDPALTAAGVTGIVGAVGVAGDGSMVYASRDRLYVATTPGGWGIPGGSWAMTPRGAAAPVDETFIHGFDIAGPTQARYVGSGRVAGRLLSPWSMSERAGLLRVATTRRESWPDPVADNRRRILPAPSAGSMPSPIPEPPVPPRPPQTDSALTVLSERNGDLEQVGQVSGLGKTEEVKSVRWFDDLAVVVTFRQTDPLYVVDLTDPRQPRVRGELKVDGFSAYLHPIGDRRLLGIGSSANATTGMVTGAQVAVFDISSPDRPTRLDVALHPQAWARVSADPRAFTYLPGIRTVLYPIEGPVSGSTGVHGSRLVAFAIRANGSLVEIGSVAMPQGWNTGQVALDGTRVALVAGGWAGQPSQVSVIDAGGSRLLQTGVLRMPVT